MMELKMITQLCRTCLQNIQQGASVSILDSIQIKLKECVSVEVQENDQLPKKICSACLTFVESIAQFRKMCRENETVLKNLIEKVDITEEYFRTSIENIQNNHSIGDNSVALNDHQYLQHNVKFENQEHCGDFTEVKHEFSDDWSEDYDGFFDSSNNISPDSKKSKRKSKVKTSRKAKQKQARRNKYRIIITDDLESSNDDKESADDDKNNAKENDDGKYPCSQCDNVFARKQSLNKHMATHPGSLTVSCLDCSMVFGDEKALSKHRQKKHDDSPPKYTCQETDCTGLFWELGTYVKHLSQVHKLPKLQKCDHCDARFIVVDQLNKHIARKHIKKESGQKELCQLCGESFANVKRHMLKHNQGKIVKQCKYCDESFASAKSLWRHVHNTHESKVCHICGVVYHKRDHLASHDPNAVPTQKAKDMEMCRCEMCGKGMTRSRLADHLRQVHFPKMVQCKICHKDVRKKTYNKHVRLVHEQSIRGTCAVCNAQFKERYSLKLHMRTHTDERPYPCPFCERSFRDSGTMKKHVRLHTGEKPYVCKICGKAFAQQTPLQTHIKVHAKQTNAEYAYHDVKATINVVPEQTNQPTSAEFAYQDVKGNISVVPEPNLTQSII